MSGPKYVDMTEDLVKFKAWVEAKLKTKQGRLQVVGWLCDDLWHGDLKGTELYRMHLIDNAAGKGVSDGQ